jgi:hypothetical protein
MGGDDSGRIEVGLISLDTIGMSDGQRAATTAPAGVIAGSSPSSSAR